jgi:hypothetical protein
MKLGLWNRLAIVATGLVMLIGPVAVMASIAYDVFPRQQASLDACNAAVDAVTDWRERNAQRDECWENYLDNLKAYTPWTWANWREIALGFAITCVAAYALIFAAQWIARWVLAGRTIKNTK